MRVHVYSPNALSIDDDLASPLRGLRRRGAQTASDKRQSRASSMAKHFSSVCHHLRFSPNLYRWAFRPDFGMNRALPHQDRSIRVGSRAALRFGESDGRLPYRRSLSPFVPDLLDIAERNAKRRKLDSSLSRQHV
jgi:hypothetical protein